MSYYEPNAHEQKCYYCGEYFICNHGTRSLSDCNSECCSEKCEKAILAVNDFIENDDKTRRIYRSDCEE